MRCYVWKLPVSGSLQLNLFSSLEVIFLRLHYSTVYSVITKFKFRGLFPFYFNIKYRHWLIGTIIINALSDQSVGPLETPSCAAIMSTWLINLMMKANWMNFDYSIDHRSNLDRRLFRQIFATEPLRQKMSCLKWIPKFKIQI